MTSAAFKCLNVKQHTNAVWNFVVILNGTLAPAHGDSINKCRSTIEIGSGVGFSDVGWVPNGTHAPAQRISNALMPNGSLTHYCPTGTLLDGSDNLWPNTTFPVHKTTSIIGGYIHLTRQCAESAEHTQIQTGGILGSLIIVIQFSRMNGFVICLV